MLIPLPMDFAASTYGSLALGVKKKQAGLKQENCNAFKINAIVAPP